MIAPWVLPGCFWQPTYAVRGGKVLQMTSVKSLWAPQPRPTITVAREYNLAQIR